MESKEVHIHNYTMFAINNFIDEVKKCPIVYNESRGFRFGDELVDLEWGRILTGFLDKNCSMSCTDREYWHLSIRALWKWMRLVLIDDIKGRMKNPFYFRSSKYNWLELLDFAESYINVNEQGTVATELSHQFRVVSTKEEKKFPTDCHVYWIKGSRESEEAQTEWITYRFWCKANVCVESSEKEHFEADIVLGSGGNDLPPTIESIFPSIPLESGSFLAGDLTPLPWLQSSDISTSPAISDVTKDHVLPQQQHSLLVVDEDFEFVMSLLPKLRKLDSKANTEVKLLMLHVLHDALS